MPDLSQGFPSVVRGYVFILIAVLFWGGSASLAKFLFTTRLDTLIVVQTRSSLSFLLLAGYFLLRNPSVFRVERRDHGLLLLTGVIGIAVTNFTYYYTVREASVATAILLQYTAPVLVMLFAVFISKEESLNGIKVIALILSTCGCLLAVSGGNLSSLNIQGLPIASGFCASLGFAFMLLASKRLLRTYSVWTMLTYAFGWSAVFWLVINPPWEIVAKGYSASDWGILWAFAVVSVLIPHSLFASALKILDATTVGIATTMEPVVAIVVAYLALGESLDAIQVLGGVAVIAAVALLQVNSIRRAVQLREVTGAW